MTNFDFTMQTEEIGRLSPEEVKFFYYDVAIDTLSNSSLLYVWDETIKEFLDNKGIEVKPVEKLEDIPTSYEKDKMYFLVEAKDTEPSAFFRHLRNAFSHYRIVSEYEYLHMKDYYEKEKILTMIGELKYDDLKNLCFLFRDQEKKIWEKIESEREFIP